MIIAIDGPAASGKGTLARRLAEHFDLAYLDTGSLYRATALRVLDAGGDPADPDTAETAAKSLDATTLDSPRLRQPEVGAAASLVAAIPGVRAALLAFQRDFAADPPGDTTGAILDGRDIGSVVLPDADAKIFLTASAEARAERRHKELQQRGTESIRAAVLRELAERDTRDGSREAAPMVQAPDALLLDTTNLDADAAFAAAVKLVLARLQ
ncbi:MAG: (d)CMP kinase [Alphaproteobacteria bacterium]|jgi:cytidylate kinase|nr:(d)CMP kinase [Alphaproteobacteria bacterium]